jgi:transposase
VLAPTPAPRLDLTPEQRHIAALERDVAGLTHQLKELSSAHERLRRAYTHALEQLQLLRHNLFVAKAERKEACAEQLAFDAMFEQVKHLEKALAETPLPSGAKEDEKERPKPKRPPTGRRDLSTSTLPVVRVELKDPELEGKAKCIGFEESSRLGYERGGFRRIILARAVYKVTEAAPEATKATEATAREPSATKDVKVTEATPEATEATEATACEPSATKDVKVSMTKSLPSTQSTSHFITVPRPKELFRRSFLAPSVIAYLLIAKYMMGIPFYRLEEKLALEGAPLDRGTMCRYAEDVGATLGAIVEAARKEAFDTAFCLSTDATGVSIQLGPIAERKDPKRGPCRKAHFFVVLADRDHVFFDYQPKHTSAVVCEMFKGFSGYIQADAHAIYDALFRGTPPRGAPPDKDRGPPPTEVGCWSHCRRNFFEAAVCKHALGVAGLRLIDAIFAADRPLAELAPAQRKAQRQVVVRPHVDALFEWVKAEHRKPRERGLVATALGYAIRQEEPLRRFLEDGRLRLDNNGSERALRTIAVGRKNWLFFGSDDHASAAGNLFSLIASCKLHRLDPEAYFEDIIRVMPYWPTDRYLELSPKYWATTRARLNDDELKRPLGHITVPPPLAAEKQSPTS